MKTLLSFLLTQLATDDPDLIEYAFVYWLIDEWDREYRRTAKKIKKEMEQSQRALFNLELDYTSKNLKELGIELDVPINVYDKDFMSKGLNKLVEKQLIKLDLNIRSQIMNVLNTEDLAEIERNLKTLAKQNKKSSGVISNIMRIYRTEGTRMRSRVKLDIQKKLFLRGINVKRVWLHSISNTQLINTSEYTPRSDHITMDGQVENELGLFYQPQTMATTEAPGLFGIPEEDINCRCDVYFTL